MIIVMIIVMSVMTPTMTTTTTTTMMMMMITISFISSLHFFSFFLHLDASVAPRTNLFQLGTNFYSIVPKPLSTTCAILRFFQCFISPILSAICSGYIVHRIKKFLSYNCKYRISIIQ